ncbi:MAG TPA: ACT domain-containing protein [Pseudonocardiaceae bacterium]
MLDGRYVLERATPDVEGVGDGEVLAIVRGPDGGACMRRQDAADDAWVALWNGDEAHPPEATGMLAAIVAPLAAGNVPVWVAASFDGDIVLIPVDHMDAASALLRQAGHRVIG